MDNILITPYIPKVLLTVSSNVVSLLYNQGKIREEDYKKYLLDTSSDYLPPLIKE